MDILIKNIELPPMGKQICLWVMHNGTVWHEDARDMIPTVMEAIPVPEHGDLIARGWHLGEPSKYEQGWFLTKVMVRDCDGSFFPEYEACFKYEEWVGRRHRQPVVAYQLIEPTGNNLAVVRERIT